MVRAFPLSHLPLMSDWPDRPDARSEIPMDLGRQLELPVLPPTTRQSAHGPRKGQARQPAHASSSKFPQLTRLAQTRIGLPGVPSLSPARSTRLLEGALECSLALPWPFHGTRRTPFHASQEKGMPGCHEPAERSRVDHQAPSLLTSRWQLATKAQCGGSLLACAIVSRRSIPALRASTTAGLVVGEGERGL